MNIKVMLSAFLMTHCICAQLPMLVDNERTMAADTVKNISIEIPPIDADEITIVIEEV